MNVTSVKGFSPAVPVQRQATPSVANNPGPLSADSVQFSGRRARIAAAALLPLGLMLGTGCSAGTGEMPEPTSVTASPQPTEQENGSTPEPSQEPPSIPPSVPIYTPSPVETTPPVSSEPPEVTPLPTPDEPEVTPTPTPEAPKKCGTLKDESFALTPQTQEGAVRMPFGTTDHLKGQLTMLKFWKSPYVPPVVPLNAQDGVKIDKISPFAPIFQKPDTIILRANSGPVREIAMVQQKSLSVMHLTDDKGNEYIATQLTPIDRPVMSAVMPTLQQVNDRAAVKEDVKAFNKLVQQASKLIPVKSHSPYSQLAHDTLPAYKGGLQIAVFDSADKGKVCFKPLKNYMKEAPIPRDPLIELCDNDLQPIPRDPNMPFMLPGDEDKGHSGEPIPRDPQTPFTLIDKGGKICVVPLDSPVEPGN